VRKPNVDIRIEKKKRQSRAARLHPDRRRSPRPRQHLFGVAGKKRKVGKGQQEDHPFRKKGKALHHITNEILLPEKKKEGYRAKEKRAAALFPKRRPERKKKKKQKKKMQPERRDDASVYSMLSLMKICRGKKRGRKTPRQISKVSTLRILKGKKKKRKKGGEGRPPFGPISAVPISPLFIKKEEKKREALRKKEGPVASVARARSPDTHGGKKKKDSIEKFTRVLQT